MTVVKRVIAIFAFSFFFYNYAAQIIAQPPPDLTPPASTLPAPTFPGPIPPTVPPPPLASPPSSLPPEPILLPDLTISDITLIEDAKVEVELGEKHEVRAIGDDEERVVEENELKNAPLLLPDLTITNLFLNPQKRLAVVVANIGDSPIPLGNENLKVFIDGSLKGIYALKSISDQSTFPSRGIVTFITPLTIVGQHEIHAQIDPPYYAKESNKNNNSLIKILKGVPIGPDIVVKDLDLTEDLNLTIILSNAGEVDLRKGAIFQIRILVNERKISEFDHFISDVLMANHGNRYIIEPPYHVEIARISDVKIVIFPRFSSDDILLENNILKRTFIIYPFKMEPKGRGEYSFSFPSPHPQSKEQMRKLKAEARWEGGGSPIMLSFKKLGVLQGTPTFVGRNPLKAEIPIPDEVQDESVWSISVANLVNKKVEGKLIIQHP